MSELTTSIDAVPGVGGPAARALTEQGLATVGDLAGADWTQLALEDVDRDVLRELVAHAWASDPTAC